MKTWSLLMTLEIKIRIVKNKIVPQIILQFCVGGLGHLRNSQWGENFCKFSRSDKLSQGISWQNVFSKTPPRIRNDGIFGGFHLYLSELAFINQFYSIMTRLVWLSLAND